MQSLLQEELDELDICNRIDLYAVIGKILSEPVGVVTNICPHLTYLTRKDPALPLWTVESVFKAGCHLSQGPGTRLKYVIAKVRPAPPRQFKIYATLPPRNRLYTVHQANGNDRLFRGLWEDGCEHLFKNDCLRCFLSDATGGESSV